MFSKSALALICLSLFLTGHLWAQVEDVPDSAAESDVSQIEAELEKAAPKNRPAPKGADKPEQKLETFSDLGKLAPFSEVSIIQKRYLPKTGRFQAFGGLAYTTNDPWFWGFGYNLKFGYFLTEAWGFEATYMGISTTEKQAVKDLSTNNHVSASSLITVKSYLGGDLVWTPVYGKMSLDNRRIIPFDMYFSVGMGSTGTADSQSASTYHVGTGQIFAISKRFGFRWDFSWNRFSAKITEGGTNDFDNLLLTLGMSFFFPEAKYR